jgi:phage host-nuclease inhibitor protein Gam
MVSQNSELEAEEYAYRIREIGRCEREIQAMETQPPNKPAIITTLGILDWHMEIERIKKGVR